MARVDELGRTDIGPPTQRVVIPYTAMRAGARQTSIAVQRRRVAQPSGRDQRRLEVYGFFISVGAEITSPLPWNRRTDPADLVAVISQIPSLPLCRLDLDVKASPTTRRHGPRKSLTLPRPARTCVQILIVAPRLGAFRQSNDPYIRMASLRQKARMAALRPAP